MYDIPNATKKEHILDFRDVYSDKDQLKGIVDNVPAYNRKLVRTQ